MCSQNAPAFLKRLVAALHVLCSGVAGNISRRVRRREIKLRIQKRGVEILGVLEIGNSLINLSIFKSLDSVR